jgi:hypothetical protein
MNLLLLTRLPVVQIKSAFFAPQINHSILEGLTDPTLQYLISDKLWLKGDTWKGMVNILALTRKHGVLYEQWMYIALDLNKGMCLAYRLQLFCCSRRYKHIYIYIYIYIKSEIKFWRNAVLKFYKHSNVIKNPRQMKVENIFLFRDKCIKYVYCKLSQI